MEKVWSTIKRNISSSAIIRGNKKFHFKFSLTECGTHTPVEKTTKMMMFIWKNHSRITRESNLKKFKLLLLKYYPQKMSLDQDFFLSLHNSNTMSDSQCKRCYWQIILCGEFWFCLKWNCRWTLNLNIWMWDNKFLALHCRHLLNRLILYKST